MLLHKAATIPFLLTGMFRPQRIAQQNTDCSNENMVISMVQCNDKNEFLFWPYNTGINFCFRGT